MIAKGSQPLRPASIGGLLHISGTCMKTITRSGQAWRGYHCARRGLGWIEALARSTQAAAAARWHVVACAHAQRCECGKVRTACCCGFLVGLWRKKTARAGGYGHMIAGKLLARWHIQAVRGEADHLLTQPVIQFHHAVL